MFAKLGAMNHLVYCAPRLTGRLFAECRIPGVDGAAGLEANGSDAELAAAMVRKAVDACVSEHPAAAVAVLADGPYGVPRKG